MRRSLSLWNGKGRLIRPGKDDYFMADLEILRRQGAEAAAELIREAGAKPGQIMVVGCSSSEIIGGVIGKNSTYEAAEAVFDGIYSEAKKAGLYIAAQCCEHLNRAVILEKECAEKYGLEEVCVVPKPKAGGSFATCCWSRLDCPTAVEKVSAHLGMDVGNTLIGMHLRAVAVPVRLSVRTIGEAPVTAARTRPKFIGGCRACYE